MQASIEVEKKNKQILERFIQSIKSEVTQVNVIDYINAYMRHWHLYEEEEELDDIRDRKKIIYRYDWLAEGHDGVGGGKDIQTIQDMIIQFVIHKKKQGLGASGIDNYITPLQKFYWVNGIKGIDWDSIRSYKPEHVKKTLDREYYSEEIIAIEDKLDVRGKVVSGVMRGSGLRRGAEPTISVGDFYSNADKIWQDIQNLGL